MAKTIIKAMGTTEGPPTGGAPLILAKQGSFFVNAQQMETSFAHGSRTSTPGHLSAKGMYVQYQIPQARSQTAHPIILVPGASHTAKCYEETPDGRMDWAEYFVRKGISTYIVDPAGRARSGFDPSPTNRARLEGEPELVPNFRLLRRSRDRNYERHVLMRQQFRCTSLFTLLA